MCYIEVLHIVRHCLHPTFHSLLPYLYLGRALLKKGVKGDQGVVFVASQVRISQHNRTLSQKIMPLFGNSSSVYHRPEYLMEALQLNVPNDFLSNDERKYRVGICSQSRQEIIGPWIWS